MSLQKASDITSGMSKPIKKQRDNTIDCMKGIAIILMVIGHSGPIYPQVRNWIYLFHMAIFFMISGYLWNADTCSDFQSVKKYVIKKIKSLYIPYVFFNGIMILLNNLFINLKIYTDNPMFLDIAKNAESIAYKEYMGISDTIVQLLKTILFMGSTQFGGATWFLRILFVVSVMNCFIEFILNQIHIKKYKPVFYILIFLLCCLGITMFDNLSLTIPIKSIHILLFQIVSAYLVYLVGILLKKYNDILNKKIYSPCYMILAFIILTLIDNRENKISFASGTVSNALFFLTVSLLGWIMVMTLSKFLSGKLKCDIAYIGSKSLSIMLFHFLAFRLVTLLYLIVTHGNMLLLASFPCLDCDSDRLWILYTLVGICIPITLNFIYEKARDFIGKNPISI